MDLDLSHTHTHTHTHKHTTTRLNGFISLFLLLFAPPAFPSIAWTARVGSGFFLVIQMVILLDFVQSWNDSWVESGEEDVSWYYALLGEMKTFWMIPVLVCLVLLVFPPFAPFPTVSPSIFVHSPPHPITHQESRWQHTEAPSPSLFSCSTGSSPQGWTAPST